LTRIAVFTPTIRSGGLDVTIASLKRQSLREGTSLLWIVIDAHKEDRSGVLGEHAMGIDWAYFKQPVPEPGKSNLCAACNQAVAIARNFRADILVTLQDYVWIPADGLRRFTESTAPRSLTAGVCHHALKPGAEAVFDWEGLYSIFAFPFTGKPEGIAWADCRHVPGAGVKLCDVTHWEPPFAAIGKECLYDTRLYFDEAFDRAFRYENQDYAYRAKSLGYNIFVDHQNEAIQLPHWNYFPADYAEHNSAEEQNRKLIQERWGV
jgi:hypothetical protein